MKSNRLNGTAVALISVLVVAVPRVQSHAGDVYWHIDPNVESCSMVMDPALTQDQWHRFAEQAGAMVTFKSMASATTLGKMNFRVSIDASRTPVDQHDPAWINTFTHPDEDCPLGDVISIPTLRAAMGVSDRMDIGGFWTTAPRANYGMAGGEIKYGLLRESDRYPAAAVRASAVFLTGVPDFDLNIYSLDVTASKTFTRLSPYVGFRSSFIMGTENTSKVDLKDERFGISQGYAGAVYTLWSFSLAAEYDIGPVNTLQFALGFNL